MKSWKDYKYTKGNKCLDCEKLVINTAKRCHRCAQLQPTNHKLKKIPTPNAIHRWIEQRLLKPINCVKCKKKRKLELSNNCHTYKRNLKDWEWICRSCHSIKDGSIKNFGDKINHGK